MAVIFAYLCVSLNSPHTVACTDCTSMKLQFIQNVLEACSKILILEPAESWFQSQIFSPYPLQFGHDLNIHHLT